jgi:fluoride exporter
MLIDALVVGLGGALGSLLRAAGLWTLPPTPGGVPWVTAGTNVLGAFLLGVVVSVLTAGTPWSARVRLFLATGVLGSFTTFSALAVDAVVLVESGHPGAVGAYLLVTVSGGLLAAATGLTVGRALGDRA